MNLYRVVVCGHFSSFGGGSYGNDFAYVVAENPSEAANKVTKFLKDKDLGYDKDRCLKSVEFLAIDDEYPDNARLFL